MVIVQVVIQVDLIVNHNIGWQCRSIGVKYKLANILIAAF